MEVDFSDTSISIEESLYRVASRLGIVDPHFDYYQGRNSMGDIKIQSFAKMAFPQNPIKIEEPMAWIGDGRRTRRALLPHPTTDARGVSLKPSVQNFIFTLTRQKKG